MSATLNSSPTLHSTARTFGRHDARLARSLIKGVRRSIPSTARTVTTHSSLDQSNDRGRARPPPLTARTIGGRHDAQLARSVIKGAHRSHLTARTIGGRHDAQLARSVIEGARRSMIDLRSSLPSSMDAMGPSIHHSMHPCIHASMHPSIIPSIHLDCPHHRWAPRRTAR